MITAQIEAIKSVTSSTSSVSHIFGNIEESVEARNALGSKRTTITQIECPVRAQNSTQCKIHYR